MSQVSKILDHCRLKYSLLLVSFCDIFFDSHLKTYFLINLALNREFEELAVGVLGECYSADQERAYKLLHRRCPRILGLEAVENCLEVSSTRLKGFIRYNFFFFLYVHFPPFSFPSTLSTSSFLLSWHLWATAWSSCTTPHAKQPSTETGTGACTSQHRCDCW